MKKILSVCLVILMALSVFSVTASAEAVVGIGYYDAESDGLYYCFYEDESFKEAYVVGYEMDVDNIAPAGAITIPETVTHNGYEYTVTGIESDAFYMSLFTTVTLPSTITYIGDYAFSTCDYLENVIIPNDCKFDYFGLDVFLTTPFESVIYSKDETIFGQNVLFSYIGNADEYVIPANIDIIANHCFFMSSVKNVVLNDKIEEIPEYAFASCRNIKSIIIPDNVTIIRTGAFKDCTSLENVTLGNGVRQIGVEAFANTKIKSIHLGENVYNITGAFKDCNNLESVTVDVANTALLTDGSAIYFKSSFFMFDDNGEEGLILEYYLPNKAQGNITVKSTVKAIGGYAFYNCKDLKEITAKNVLYVDGEAFAGSGIEKFSGNSLALIYENAFRSCKNLSNIDVSNVLYIGNGAFQNCTSLKDVKFADSVFYIGALSFANTGVTEVIVNGDECEIGEAAFKDCENLKSVRLEDGVTIVGKNAFLECPELETIYISKNVKEFDDNAFNGCENVLFQVIDGSRAHRFIKNLGFDFEIVGRLSFFERIVAFFENLFSSLFGWII
ncbi:MAG: leucine-rich repeat domain-containing protein [Clostridia bacterium]|nr:leucine-rich repeat domain-containing protein [Clostridia bacterium]